MGNSGGGGGGACVPCVTCNASKINQIFDEVSSKKTSSLGCGWNANESKLKVIFFILLLLLIAAGSLHCSNVATTTCKNL